MKYEIGNYSDRDILYTSLIVKYKFKYLTIINEHIYHYNIKLDATETKRGK